MTDPILWYFADPMCSWCYGFGPVVEALREDCQGRAKVALILGGLRPGNSAVMGAQEVEEIQHHWHAVQARTGQPFRFDGAMGVGFVYDTEPACRAVVAMSALDGQGVFPMFKAIQSAFYEEGHDVTRTDALVRLAVSLGMDGPAFLAAFESETMLQKTRAHFEMARRLGVRTFPTLVAQRGKRHQVLANGYQPLTELRPGLEAWLTLDAATPPAG